MIYLHYVTFRTMSNVNAPGLNEYDRDLVCFYSLVEVP
jgi:hypothetical protein